MCAALLHRHSGRVLPANRMSGRASRRQRFRLPRPSRTRTKGMGHRHSPSLQLRRIQGRVIGGSVARAGPCSQTYWPIKALDGETLALSCRWCSSRERHPSLPSKCSRRVSASTPPQSKSAGRNGQRGETKETTTTPRIARLLKIRDF